MIKIFALTDYKNHFGSKWGSKPYRSGYDKELIKKYLSRNDYDIEFIRLHDIDFSVNWADRIIIYTSSEETGLYYKSFVEDIILGLTKRGAKLIPGFDFLRANNNKVYMEILKYQILGEEFGYYSRVYGTADELVYDIDRDKIISPCVIKKAEGSMSRNVFLCNNRHELVKKAKNLSRTSNYLYELKELIREVRYKGYSRESSYQGKFIIQRYIPNLHNDWKILIYGDHYYILNRGIRKNDFRASGSHFRYRTGSESDFPEDLLDVVRRIYLKFDIPHLSLDIAFDGENLYVHEFQAVYFGTSTINLSDDYFTLSNDKWITEKKQCDQEEEYVLGIVRYLERHPELILK